MDHTGDLAVAGHSVPTGAGGPQCQVGVGELQEQYEKSSVLSSGLQHL